MYAFDKAGATAPLRSRIGGYPICLVAARLTNALWRRVVGQFEFLQCAKTGQLPVTSAGRL